VRSPAPRETHRTLRRGSGPPCSGTLDTRTCPGTSATATRLPPPTGRRKPEGRVVHEVVVLAVRGGGVRCDDHELRQREDGLCNEQAELVPGILGAEQRRRGVHAEDRRGRRDAVGRPGRREVSPIRPGLTGVPPRRVADGSGSMGARASGATMETDAKGTRSRRGTSRRLGSGSSRTMS